MNNKLEKKKKLVEELIVTLNNSEAILVSEYSGLSANSMTALRKSLKREGFDASVLKNKMVSRSFSDLKLTYPDSLLKGPNIYFNTKSDVVKLSKILIDYKKENDSLSIKGGFLNGNYISESEIKTLAKLPSKEELIAKAVGLIKSPLSGLVGTLANPVNSLVNVLNNIKNNK
ncbi:50S ribosomal protein L10 [Candidatus Marinamargulisbacteria bacterium SCGC AG-343-D04]|nr:50S ribosomal protein L10 [Candidatus Marinamargulisbacteria bacterium SCGC AG-343-D04]